MLQTNNKINSILTSETVSVQWQYTNWKKKKIEIGL